MPSVCGLLLSRPVQQCGYGMSRADTAAARVDTRSARYKACVHLCAHALIAEEFGWQVCEMAVYEDGTGHTHVCNPFGLDVEVEVLQRVAFLLAGPAASRRLGRVRPLPAGCRWDKKWARRALREAGSTAITYRKAETLARTLVTREWSQIRISAHDLYLAERWS
jgi:hypothetical protein